MSRRASAARVRYWWTRWIRSAPHLQLVFMLGGAAVSLAFLVVDVLITDWVWHWPDASPLVRVPVLVAVFLVPPTVIGLLVQMRETERLTASIMLSTRFPQGVDRGSWSSRVRACLWFWCHLLAGTAVGLGGIMCTIGVGQLGAAPWREPGTDLLGTGWLRVHGGVADLRYLVLAVLMIATYLAGLALAGQVLVTLAPVLLGPTYEERLQALEHRTLELAGRNHLARELHDSVGHALSAVVLQAAAARRRVRSAPQAAEDGLAEVESAARRALDELDTVLGILRADEDRGRAPAADLSALTELLTAAQKGSTGTVTVIEQRITADALPAPVSLEGYRILQEALTNAMRHGGGSAVEVGIVQTADALDLWVTNEIKAGRPWSRSAIRSGQGVSGMKERVRLLDGCVRAGPVDGRWEVRATLPLTSKGLAGIHGR